MRHDRGKPGIMKDFFGCPDTDLGGDIKWIRSGESRGCMSTDGYMIFLSRRVHSIPCVASAVSAAAIASSRAVYLYTVDSRYAMNSPMRSLSTASMPGSFLIP